MILPHDAEKGKQCPDSKAFAIFLVVVVTGTIIWLINS